MDTKMHINGNDITLKNIKHEVNEKSRTYHTWHGVYEIIESTLPVTIEDIGQLSKYGLFGYGQMVNASLHGKEIHYSGTCDSGD